MAIGLFPGEDNPLLTLVPAMTAVAGIAAVLFVARRATSYSEREEADHPKVATAISSVANAVAATDQIVLHRSRRRSLVGALAYLAFDALVLWTAFFAINFNVAMMIPLLPFIQRAIGLTPDVGGLIAMAGMTLMFAISAIQHTRKLYREEPGA